MVNLLPPNRLRIAQQERLLYIDLCLRFLGSVRRQDLINRFGVQSAAATRDLAQYRSEVPDNLVFLTRTKSYFRSPEFSPLYPSITSEDALAWLCPGEGQSGLLDNEIRLAVDRSRVRGNIQIDVLEMVSRAIHQELALEIRYCSPFTGDETFQIAPHALVDLGGLRLVRAFSRGANTFSKFRLNWINTAVEVPGGIREMERPQLDTAWGTQMALELVPHPDNVAFPKALEKEFGLVDGVWRVKVRAALVKSWVDGVGADTTKDHHMRGPQFVWWVRSN